MLGAYVARRDGESKLVPAEWSGPFVHDGWELSEVTRPDGLSEPREISADAAELLILTSERVAAERSSQGGGDIPATAPSPGASWQAEQTRVMLEEPPRTLPPPRLIKPSFSAGSARAARCRCGTPYDPVGGRTACPRCGG